MASPVSFGAGRPVPALPHEMWVTVLSQLFEPVEVMRAREVCRTFREVSLPAFRLHFSEQTSVTAQTIEQYHLPLFYLLVFNSPDFADHKKHAAANAQKAENIWKDYLVPEIFSYALSNCTSATEVDLTGSRYSADTFIGKPADFASEVSTLEWTPSIEATPESYVQDILGAVPQTFRDTYPVQIVLPKVTTLKLKAGEANWEILAQVFPNVSQLEVGGAPAPDEAKRHFLLLEAAEKD